MNFAVQSVLLAVALSVAAPAYAESSAPSAADIKRAADAFDRGRDAFRADEYIEAAEHFEAADGHAPSAQALRFALTARQRAGQMARAASIAALALARHPEDEELSELSQEVIAEASESLYKVEVSCDEPCELVLNNKIVHGQRMTERVIFVEPGAHRLRASWPGDRNRTERLEAVAGSSSYVNFFVPEAKSEGSVSWDLGSDESAVEKERSGWSPTVFWTGVGVTVAGAAATTLLGLRAQSNPGPDRVRTACASYTGPDRAACPEYQEGLRNQRQTNVALAATSVVGVFTLVTGLFLTDWESDDPTYDAARSKQRHTAQRGFAVKPWFGVGETTAIGASGTF